MRASARPIKDSIKSVVTQRTLQQVITAERAEFTDAMMKTARPFAEQLGVELVDVRITKIESAAAGPGFGVRAHACDLQGAGREAARRRRGGIGPDSRRSEQGSRPRFWPMRRGRRAQTRGQGDASASEVYAKSYSKNAEFYSFYRSMQSYREAIGTQGDMLVIAAGQCVLQVLQQTPTAASEIARARHGNGYWMG